MSIPQVSVDQLAVALDAGAPLYDVREPGEYQKAHVGGATLIPLGEVVASLDDFDTDRPIYLICATGRRSGKAAEYLRSNGLDAHNVSGGTSAWIKSGREALSGASRF